MGRVTDVSLGHVTHVLSLSHMTHELSRSHVLSLSHKPLFIRESARVTDDPEFLVGLYLSSHQANGTRPPNPSTTSLSSRQANEYASAKSLNYLGAAKQGELITRLESSTQNTVRCRYEWQLQQLGEAVSWDAADRAGL